MLFIVNGVEKRITLRKWDERSSRWGEDMFPDLETDHTNGCDVTPEEYQDIIDYWESELEAYTDGYASEHFGQRDWDDLEDETLYSFEYDEVTADV